MMELKCPNCGDAEHLYRNVEMRWSPTLGTWEVTYKEMSAECTQCDTWLDLPEEHV